MDSSPDTFALTLKSLRDTLRNPTSLSSEDLAFHLSSTLQSLHVHPTSIGPSQVFSENLKAITRYLPSIQDLLLNQIIPTFYDSLNPPDQVACKTFFVPSKTNDGLSVRRQIGLCSYTTLPSYLSSPKPGQSALVKPSRKFLLDIVEELVNTYGIDDLYYSVYIQDTKGKGKEDGTKSIQWEEAMRAAVGIPAKVGNAVGRWQAEGGVVDVAKGLEARPYFHRLIVKLEGLMHEISQSTPSADTAPIRIVFEKLCSIGLLSPSPSLGDARSPALLPSLLPPLLKHLHPPSTSPLQPYPARYLPSIFLSLPSSALASFVESLISHLTLHLIQPSSPLEPGKPDGRIKRSVEVLTQIVGPPKTGEEAWNAVLRTVLSGKNGLKMSDQQAQARNRLIVGWIARGGEDAVRIFIESLIERWTDPKYVKFTLFSQQLNLTHILLLALSLLLPLSPWLVALSHRSRVIMAFQSYLSHPDPMIRRLGMLVAEILSELTIPEDTTNGENIQMDDEIEDLRKGLEDVDTKGVPKSDKKASGGMKRLKFTGIWDGDGEGREECRWLRRIIGTRDDDAILSDRGGNEEDWLLGWNDQIFFEEHPMIPESIPAPSTSQTRGRPPASKPKQPKASSKPKSKPKIVMLDPDQLDDPMEGYASSSRSSSRSPSPTPSYLEEVAADPSLAIDTTQKKKVTRPVYIPQLTALLKERDKPESIEMGLKYGEGLIRAKREFGTELAENAVAVTLMTLGLNDSFNLDEFDEKRQGIMNALVACSPKEVAPFLCEQYFNTQYSLQQKSAILTALAMGARELAGLSVPTPPTTKKIDFPSKTLPPSLHRKYLTIADIPPSRREPIENGQLEETMSGMRNMLLSKGARKGDDVPEIARERRLKVGNRKGPLMAELGSLRDSQMISSSSPKPVIAYKDIAGEYFVMPLINRFWEYYKVQSSRMAYPGNYKGTGTGMILSPLGLEKFLITLCVLLNAARHSPLFLGVLAPEALELALTLGIRFSSSSKARDGDEMEGIDSLVIGSSLELCLVVLDTCVELDGGRSLTMDRSDLLLGIGEWATTIFQNEMEGNEVAGGQGGRAEGRIRAGAAAVVLKVGEVGERFGGMGVRF
ncbi:hypothetical protein I302_108245 [Kwoniella bestiolae CBS 10118]|uniref:Telomere length regulation protein conserved domain-containing protein n=1 Tax=Kwoniella bestiolae CBS 10118 TaxID=1296100 RepID=A0A1B9FW90_9TREE|nr:hypothetical protein I302_07389 [Kwoniella bestiolae CBS 10118]OCF23039.1 hypothetical protein I302_07389 [Kwoniella bestiolae CBS 10118]